jgi:hypothetical protein
LRKAPNSSRANADAKVIGKHLEKLSKQLKRELTAKDVLDDARNRTSPIHSFFEWNDGEAAEQYRLGQARGLIRSVVAIYVKDDQPAVQTRASVSTVQQGGAQVHEMTPAETHDAVLRRAVRELMAWRKRYEGVTELAPVFSVADLVEKSLVAEEEKVAA